LYNLQRDRFHNVNIYDRDYYITMGICGTKIHISEEDRIMAARIEAIWDVNQLIKDGKLELIRRIDTDLPISRPVLSYGKPIGVNPESFWY
jgi:hypothetical protein